MFAYEYLGGALEGPPPVVLVLQTLTMASPPSPWPQVLVVIHPIGGEEEEEG